QERMLVVIEKGKEQKIIDIFTHWELDAVKIGEVVDGKNVDLLWHGELVSSIPVSVLTSAVPQYRWPEKEPAEFKTRIEYDIEQVPEPEDFSVVWSDMLGHINLCSRRPVFQQYDSTVRSNTVIHPGGDAAIIRVKNNNGHREKGIAMTLD